MRSLTGRSPHNVVPEEADAPSVSPWRIAALPPRISGWKFAPRGSSTEYQ